MDKLPNNIRISCPHCGGGFYTAEDEIHSLRAENERFKLIAETEANTAIAILNLTDDETIKDLAAHIADQLISTTDVKDL